MLFINLFLLSEINNVNIDVIVCILKAEKCNTHTGGEKWVRISKGSLLSSLLFYNTTKVIISYLYVKGAWFYISISMSFISISIRNICMCSKMTINLWPSSSPVLVVLKCVASPRKGSWGLSYFWCASNSTNHNRCYYNYRGSMNSFDFKW